MKLVIALFLLMCITAKAQNPYATLAYDSLVIYDYGFEGQGESNIKQTGKYYSFITKPVKSVRLTKTEANNFTTKIGEDSTYTQNSADCFDPHFAAFYYKKGKAIANVEVCVGCNRLYSSIEIPAKIARPEELAGYTIYPYSGLSKAFRIYLKDLLNAHGFSHAPKGTSIYD
jgi:hypothetical protein